MSQLCAGCMNCAVGGVLIGGARKPRPANRKPLPGCPPQYVCRPYRRTIKKSGPRKNLKYGPKNLNSWQEFRKLYKGEPIQEIARKYQLAKLIIS